MSRNASSNPDPGNATATIGFGASFRISRNQTVPPNHARSGSANFLSEGSPQVVSEARYNGPAVAGYVNLSGDYPARSASSTPKGKPQSQPSQGNIRSALIEADLVDCMN